MFKTKLFMGIYWAVGHIGHWGVGYMYRIIGDWCVGPVGHSHGHVGHWRVGHRRVGRVGLWRVGRIGHWCVGRVGHWCVDAVRPGSEEKALLEPAVPCTGSL